MAALLDLIKHLQNTINKRPDDEHKVLKCIDKLYHLNVTVQHLQDTGVGKTVNALRKEPGEVGNAARALVNKWKRMVADEEKSDTEDHSHDTSHYNGHGNGKDSDDSMHQSRNGAAGNSKYDNHNSTKQDKHNHTQMNGEHLDRKRKHYSSEESETDVKKSRHYQSSDSDVKVKREPTSDSDQESYSQDDHSSMSEEEVKVKSEPKDEKPTGYNSSRHDSKRDSKESSSRKSHHSSEKHQSDHRSTSHSSHSDNRGHHSDRSSSSSKHKSSKESSTDKKHKHEKSSMEKDKSSSSRHSSSSDKHRSSSQKESERSSKHTEKRDGKHSSLSVKPDKEKHKSSSDKEIKDKQHSSSSKEKNREKDKSHDRSSSTSKDKSSHSNKSDKKHSSSSSRPKSDSSKHKVDRAESNTEKDSKNKTSSSSHKSVKIKDVPKKKSQANSDDSGDDGIDCGSGASFAEALGMVSPAKSKKKVTSTTKDVCSPDTSFSNDLSPANLLAPTAKLAPLPQIEISALPEISPNYKPRPPPKLQPHMTEDEAISAGISSKNQRTKVYSGNKTYGKLPSLYELCVHVLQEHIDALEYTGGVPYEILKPIVDKASAQQLFVLEHYNPYLMEDTNHLWQKFCEKHFRGKKRQEMETWRDMFIRCQEEQEHRLKSLTANIKIAQEAKKAPVKQTKMAYVDSVVKPPRNIARKQALHGTARAVSASPAARVASLASGAGRAGSLRPSPVAVPAPAAFSKPKKAPLMAKALQFMRGRKR